MFYLVDDLKKKLEEENCIVQIVEPKRTGIKMLSMMIDMKHTNSMSHIVSANYETIKTRT
jgi:hypothetical protein